VHLSYSIIDPLMRKGVIGEKKDFNILSRKRGGGASLRRKERDGHFPSHSSGDHRQQRKNGEGETERRRIGGQPSSILDVAVPKRLGDFSEKRKRTLGVAVRRKGAVVPGFRRKKGV